MTTTRTRWTTAMGMAVSAALAFTAIAATPIRAKAFVSVGFGFGFPIGFPGYYPPYPPPPPYYPAPGAYPPPSSYSSESYQQPSGAYPPSSPYQQPFAYYPPPGSYQQPSGYPSSGSVAGPRITYTPRRGWTNAQGQYCREYKTTQDAGSRAIERYGTACRDATGQWYIVN